MANTVRAGQDYLLSFAQQGYGKGEPVTALDNGGTGMFERNVIGVRVRRDGRTIQVNAGDLS